MTASTTSMTGGVHAEGGERIVTQDSYSAVKVENVINAGNESGTSYTKIETNKNGVVTVEEYTKEIPAHSSVRVHVATSTIGQGSSAAASSTVVTYAAATSSPPSRTWLLRFRITEHVSQFFGKLFGWLSFTR